MEEIVSVATGIFFRETGITAGNDSERHLAALLIEKIFLSVISAAEGWGGRKSLRSTALNYEKTNPWLR